MPGAVRRKEEEVIEYERQINWKVVNVFMKVECKR